MSLLEDIAREDIWGKSRIAQLMQKQKAMDDKKKMEAHGWSRYAERGTCGFCEQFHEQVYAGIIDVCSRCKDRAFTAWADKKIYFKLITVKPNIDWSTGKIGIFRCQACNKRDALLHQVNIKMCIKCLTDIGKKDHYKNNANDQKKRRKQIDKVKAAMTE